MNVRKRVFLPLALLGAIIASSCGGTAEGRVEPEAYVTEACTAMGDWLDTILEESSGVVENLSPNASPEDLKARFSAFVDSVHTETEQLITQLEEAGIPDVENGEEIAEGLVGGFEDAESAFENARERIQELDTQDRVAFQQEINEIASSIQNDLADAQQAVQNLEGSEELDRAAGEVEACQEIGQ